MIIKGTKANKYLCEQVGQGRGGDGIEFFGPERERGDTFLHR